MEESGCRVGVAGDEREVQEAIRVRGARRERAGTESIRVEFGGDGVPLAGGEGEGVTIEYEASNVLSPLKNCSYLAVLEQPIAIWIYQKLPMYLNSISHSLNKLTRLSTCPHKI